MDVGTKESSAHLFLISLGVKLNTNAIFGRFNADQNNTQKHVWKKTLRKEKQKRPVHGYLDL